ncbi:MAG: phage holin family protein [Synechococcales cyanobacterium RU_4_20]|nr:phage holin family protein [Synechococcales cyanobacterium RU_4_20]NJR69133.1 phage holin family protein [Synechococcales cyanobacterium CRU_2_2]
MISLLLTLLITAVALIILSKIPGLGIQIDSFGKAVVSAIVFGLLNMLAGPLLSLLQLGPLEWITWPALFIINVIIFGLSAKLVEGFRLTNGLISAVIGAVGLTVLTQLLTALWNNLGFMGVPAA